MRFLYACLFLFFLFLGLARPAQAQLSTIGKEFWVGFMENNRIFPTPNNPGAIDYAVIVITATEDTQGAIDYLGQSTVFELKSGEQYIFRKSSLDLDLLNRGSSIPQPLGIHITASGKISVHAFNERQASADGTVILPVSALGKDYLVTSYYEFRSTTANPTVNINRESTLLIVATEPNTRVEITTTVDALSGRELKGVPFEVELQRGESYQVKARGDLTGSRVRILGSNADDCKKIAVFGGNIFTSVGECSDGLNDHLYQQAYPINTWGTSFVHTALLGRSSGELVKVLASEDNTEVFKNGTRDPRVLNRGEWISLEFESNESGKIDTSKPSSVTVFSKSQSCNSDFVRDVSGLNGDPFMITYSPTEQFLTQLNFSTITLPLIQKHYLNIVVKEGEENNTQFDGNTIGAAGGVFESIYSGYKIARIEISEGVHSLSNPAGFTAYVYGFGNPESYGYAAGAALNNLNFETESDYDFNVDGEKVACLNQEGTWTVNPENPDFTYFVWNFGDGTPTKIGKDVKHTYTKAGKYEVTIVASLSPNSCDEQEEVTFEVLVVESKAEWEGPRSVCPDETIWYKVINKEAVARIDFEVVQGGEIIDRREDEVLVKWGASGNAVLRMVPFTEDGCPGAPIDLPVVINLQIVVEKALGDTEVCYDPSVPITYSVPNPLPGRRYEWVVTGGTWDGIQGADKIEVTWGQEDIEGEIFYRAFSVVDASCAGTAPVIKVRVAKQLTLATQSITDVACFGNATGEIKMLASGGTTNSTTDYTFEWSHDANLETATASNLKAGLYSVKVIDALGCEQQVTGIEVKEPPLLEVLTLTTTPTTCFGRKDGKLRLEVIGGVGPYSLEFGGTQVFSSVFELDDLEKDNYTWEVTDSYGCKIPVAFEITSPPPLVVDVSLAKPACPGESNGELLVVPSGPAGPFNFVWTPSAQTTDLATGLAKGSYQVQVTDAAGCISFGTGIVIEEAPKIRMPNAYNPAENPLFTGVSNCVINFTLIIYNRWGQLIYSGDKGWDGRAFGEEAPVDTYTYSVNYSYLMEGNTVQVSYKGSVLLVK